MLAFFPAVRINCDSVMIMQADIAAAFSWSPIAQNDLTITELVDWYELAQNHLRLRCPML